MYKKIIVSVLVMVVMGIVLVACGGAATPTEEAAPVEEAAPAEEEAAPAEGEALDIVYIPKNTGNPYFDSIIRGFEQACEEIGCNFVTTAPATAEATSQIPFIEEQIQRGVDVLAISPKRPVKRFRRPPIPHRISTGPKR